MKKIIGYLLLLAFSASCVLILYINIYMNSSVNFSHKEIFIKKGSSLNTVTTILDENGIIKNRLIFKSIVQLKTGRKTKIKFGEYAFEKNITHRQVISKLLNGKNLLRTITFAEGLTNHSIIKILSENKYLTGKIDSVNIPEGTLLPETYSFQKGDRRQDIINKMQNDLFNSLKQEWNRKASNLPYNNMVEALIMASIIEKETGIESERELVASVFVNRLRIGMPLQTDPTSIYGYTMGDAGKEKDKRVYLLLKDNSPYNTYKNKGLPPTPICNAGVKSIRAALNPAETKYIFFVATGNGGHLFAESYAEHLRNVEKFRKIKEQKR